MASRYVAANGSNSNPGTEALPYLTATYAHSQSIPGDIIKLRRGDKFHEELILSKAGTSGNPITFEPYGDTNLANPTFYGYRQLSGWTDLGGGLYKCTDANLPGRVNCLMVSNDVQPLGRWPKTGFNTIMARTGNASGTVTDSANLPAGSGYTGAEFVTRKNAWVMDRGSVTSHSGSVLNYTGTSSGYPTKVGYGYFLQNKRAFCTTQFDWCKEGNDIVMYFGAANPNTYLVEASSIANCIKAVFRGYHTFNNIRFEGYNGDLLDVDKNKGAVFNIQGSPEMRFMGCFFRGFGNTGFYWYNCPGFTIRGCVLRDFMNIGVWQGFEANSTGIDISANDVDNIGIIPGAGGNTDIGYSFLRAVPETLGLLIEFNNIQKVGYNGLNIGGYEYYVRNNFLSECCYLLDDGGCIYTYKGSRDYVYDKNKRIIENNICINSKGNNEGKSSGGFSGEGIYIDNNASTVSGDEITIRNNVCFGNRRGLKLHDNRDMSITGNKFFDNDYQVGMFNSTLTNTFIRNIEFKDNELYAKEGQEVMIMEVKDNQPELFGDFDNNVYMRPSNEEDIIIVDRRVSPTSTAKYSLAEWKTSGLGHDPNSTGTPTESTEVEAVYNATQNAVILPLARIRINPDGTVNSTGEITLLPYTGAMLLDDLGPVTEVNDRPVASIISPATELTFSSDEPIVFETTTSDPNAGDTVDKLDLYYGALPIEKRINPNQGANTFTWQNPVPGYHKIQLIPTDNHGMVGFSSIIYITVEESSTELPESFFLSLSLNLESV